MHVVFRRLYAIMLPAAFLASGGAVGGEPAPQETAGEASPADGAEVGWQKLFREMADDYQLFSADETRRKFPLRPAPVLRWSQPVRGGDDGAVYVWLDQGRPAAIGSIFAYPRADGTRVVVHELHALTMAPMDADYQGTNVWSLDKPALEFQRVPGAAEPAAAATQRLAQIRTLGREFNAKSIDREEREWELRLLGQPLYRYELKDHPELLDGAILAFVQGTDPEILLILEARRDGDKSYWQYALARFSDLQLVLQHKETEVWRVSYSRLRENLAPYFVRDVAVRRLTDLDSGTPKAKE